jgi:D-alanyl-D-alanine carboxypeptidase/D-alanyl-D-alanine-endopeptidase (penicillin-binding protein 4)
MKPRSSAAIASLLFACSLSACLTARTPPRAAFSFRQSSRPAAPAPPARTVRPPPGKPSAAIARLQRDIDEILHAPALDRAFFGVVVKSLATQNTLYSLNAGKLMMPASTMKVVTLAGAAEKLGWDFRYETRLVPLGTISDGVLHGDMLVVGSGDPSIDDWDGAATRLFGEWSDRLKAAGVYAIEGRIIGDDNAFDDEGIGFGWSWDDLGASFAAGVSALQFNENAAQVTVSAGNAVGETAALAVVPEAGGPSVRNLVITASASSAASIERRRVPGTGQLELRGSVPLRGRPVVLNVSVDNPTLYFVTALREGLTANGIDVRGTAVDIDDLDAAPARGDAVPLVVHQSPPFSTLAATLMQYSQNQYAETFLKTIGTVAGTGTTAGGRVAVRSVLENWRIATAGLIQVDGSGLSRYNYVTPQTLVDVLSHVAGDERLRGPYEAALPVAGRDRALATRMKGTPAEGNARIKTGSMNNVRAMSGYVRTADGDKLAFAILANNFEMPATAVITAADAIVVRLASFQR